MSNSMYHRGDVDDADVEAFDEVVEAELRDGSIGLARAYAKFLDLANQGRVLTIQPLEFAVDPIVQHGEHHCCLAQERAVGAPRRRGTCCGSRRGGVL